MTLHGLNTGQTTNASGNNDHISLLTPQYSGLRKCFCRLAEVSTDFVGQPQDKEHYTTQIFKMAVQVRSLFTLKIG